MVWALSVFAVTYVLMSRPLDRPAGWGDRRRPDGGHKRADA